MENITIKFQEYLDHRMSPEEETAFKAELESDAKLKSKFVAFLLKRLPRERTAFDEPRSRSNQCFEPEANQLGCLTIAR